MQKVNHPATEKVNASIIEALYHKVAGDEAVNDPEMNRLTVTSSPVMFHKFLKLCYKYKVI